MGRTHRTGLISLAKAAALEAQIVTPFTSMVVATTRTTRLSPTALNCSASAGSVLRHVFCHLPLHRSLARYTGTCSLSSYLTVVHVRAGGCNSTKGTSTNGTLPNQMIFEPLVDRIVDRMVGGEVASASQKVKPLSGGARSRGDDKHPVLALAPILLSALLCGPRAKSVLMPL